MARKTQPKQTTKLAAKINYLKAAAAKPAKRPGGKNLRRDVLEMMGPKSKALYK